jgi:hypothetical protein
MAKKTCPLGPHRISPWDHNAAVAWTKHLNENRAYRRVVLGARARHQLVAAYIHDLRRLRRETSAAEAARRARLLAAGTPVVGRDAHASLEVVDEPYRLTPTHSGEDFIRDPEDNTRAIHARSARMAASVFWAPAGTPAPATADELHHSDDWKHVGFMAPPDADQPFKGGI